MNKHLQNLTVILILGSSLVLAGGGSDLLSGLPSVDSYNCANGTRVTAVYGANFETASIKFGKIGLLGSKTYQVEKAVAASGVRYTGDGVEWWTKGNTANLYMLDSNKALAKDCLQR
jgi:membrane-bound inhibitor of C-type lysozyme